MREQKRNPFSGDYVNFSQAVAGGRFSFETIRRWFNVLVENDGYSRSDKKVLLSQLVARSNPLRTTRNEGKTAHRAFKDTKTAIVSCRKKTPPKEKKR